jgi:hypothetical protein
MLATKNFSNLEEFLALMDKISGLLFGFSWWIYIFLIIAHQSG